MGGIGRSWQTKCITSVGSYSGTIVGIFLKRVRDRVYIQHVSHLVGQCLRTVYIPYIVGSEVATY